MPFFTVTAGAFTADSTNSPALVFTVVAERASTSSLEVEALLLTVTLYVAEMKACLLSLSVYL